MNFNTEEIKVSTPRLKGNQIHTVVFDGIEAVDLKDGLYKTLQFKFHNNEGTFTHTEFELTDDDAKEPVGQYGKQPSRLMTFMTLLRHLGNAVSPNLVALCNDKSALNNITWEQLRKKIVDAAKDGIGKETKIKLMSRMRTDANTGEQREIAEFPRYIIAYNRSGELYMQTNFIGNNTYFTNKEITRMKQAEKKPVDMAVTNSPNIDTFDTLAVTTAPKDPFDDVDIANL